MGLYLVDVVDKVDSKRRMHGALNVSDEGNVLGDRPLRKILRQISLLPPLVVCPLRLPVLSISYDVKSAPAPGRFYLGNRREIGARLAGGITGSEATPQHRPVVRCESGRGRPFAPVPCDCERPSLPKILGQAEHAECCVSDGASAPLPPSQ